MTLLIATIFTANLPALTALFAVTTFCYGSYTTIANVLPSDLFFAESVASVSGLSGTGAAVGTIIVFELAGHLSDSRLATGTHLFDPLMILAGFVLPPQQRLVPLDLHFNFAEGSLTAGQHVFSVSRGMQRSRWQRQSQRQRPLLRSRVFREDALDLHQVRLITFQEPSELIETTHNLRCHDWLRFDVLVADRNVHGCTCRLDTVSGRKATQ
jgi:hypothetical protein